MSKKALFLDAFGTLLKGGIEAILETCDEIVKSNSLDMTADEFLVIWDKIYKEILGGKFMTIWKANEVSLRATYEKLGIQDELDGYLNWMYKKWYTATLYEDAIEALPKLSKITKCMVSNADDHLLEVVMRKNNLDFEYSVSSEKARGYKPYPEIFNYALNEVGCGPDEVIHVGDSQTSDIVGGKRAGIPVIWINRLNENVKEGVPEPDYEARDLNEVVKIISEEGFFQISD